MKNKVAIKILTEIENLSKLLVPVKASNLSQKTLSILDDVEFFLTRPETSKLADSMFSDNLQNLANMMVGNEGNGDAKTD